MEVITPIPKTSSDDKTDSGYSLWVLILMAFVAVSVIILVVLVVFLILILRKYKHQNQPKITSIKSVNNDYEKDLLNEEEVNPVPSSSNKTIFA